jgi:hypothetical protein
MHKIVSLVTSALILSLTIEASRHAALMQYVRTQEVTAAPPPPPPFVQRLPAPRRPGPPAATNPADALRNLKGAVTAAENAAAAAQAAGDVATATAQRDLARAARDNAVTARAALLPTQRDATALMARAEAALAHATAAIEAQRAAEAARLERERVEREAADAARAEAERAAAETARLERERVAREAAEAAARTAVPPPPPTAIPTPPAGPAGGRPSPFTRRRVTRPSADAAGGGTPQFARGPDRATASAAATAAYNVDSNVDSSDEEFENSSNLSLPGTPSVAAPTRLRTAAEPPAPVRRPLPPRPTVLPTAAAAGSITRDQAPPPPPTATLAPPVRIGRPLPPRPPAALSVTAGVATAAGPIDGTFTPDEYAEEIHKQADRILSQIIQPIQKRDLEQKRVQLEGYLKTLQELNSQVTDQRAISRHISFVETALRIVNKKADAAPVTPPAATAAAGAPRVRRTLADFGEEETDLRGILTDMLPNGQRPVLRRQATPPELTFAPRISAASGFTDDEDAPSPGALGRKLRTYDTMLEIRDTVQAAAASGRGGAAAVLTQAQSALLKATRDLSAALENETAAAVAELAAGVNAGRTRQIRDKIEGARNRVRDALAQLPKGDAAVESNLSAIEEHLSTAQAAPLNP